MYGPGWAALELGGAPADLRVLHQDYPAALAGVAQPFLVAQTLADPLSVNVGHRVNDRAGGAERLRDEMAAEAAIYEELRGRA